MRVAPWYLCLLFVVLVHLPASGTPACADGSLRLNEIMAGPARDWDGNGTFSSRDDEWIELVNTGVTPLDLTGYFVTDGDTIPRYALSGVLAVGGHLFVTGGNSHDWEVTNGFPAFGLSLANSGDSVLLWKVTGPDTTLADGYTFKSHEAAADRATGRSPDGTGEWVIFDSLNPYTGATLPHGNGCAPTPAAPNTCNLTPTRQMPWGKMKTLYR
jgi:Lamin Tail Domain